MRGSVIITLNTSLTRRGGQDRRTGERKLLTSTLHMILTCAIQRHDTHCVTKVVLLVVGARRDSDIETCGSDTGSLCRSRSNDAGTVEPRIESDDADERIGEARFKTRGRGGNEEDVV
jgi:hypothetical protein